MSACYPALLLALILASLVGTRGAHAQERYIYWIGAIEAEETRGNTIFRYTLDSSVVDTLVQVRDVEPDSGLPRSFYYVTVDTLHRHIYWTDSGGTNPDGSINIGAIMRASLNGDSVEVFLGGIVCGIGAPQDIELDTLGETLYWSTNSDCRYSVTGFSALHRVGLESSNPIGWKPLPTNGDYQVSAIELDLHNQMLYWTNNDFFEAEPLGAYRAPLNDTVFDEYIITGCVGDIALAHTLSKIYWAFCNGSTIKRANLDGTEVEDLIVGSREIGSLTVDGQAGKIYWTETAAGNIRRANLDGTGVENVLSGLTVPGSIALSSAGEVHTSIDPAYVLPDEVGFDVNVYPNPVRDRATIEFAFTATSHATLTLYDVLGRRVAVSASRAYPAGQHSVEWDLVHLPGGVYFFHLTTDKETQTIPLVVNR